MVITHDDVAKISNFCKIQMKNRKSNDKKEKLSLFDNLVLLLIHLSIP